MKRSLLATTIIVILSVLLIATPPPVKSAKFVLASWSYPDEYGQGIDAIRLHQYLDGEWVALDGGFEVTPDDSTTFDISAFGPINITVKCWLNNTLVGASSFEDGKNYIRHSVIVSTLDNSSVFSQENFTYYQGTDALDPMFYYFYRVTMDFIPEYSTIYTAVISYEIFYEVEA